MKRQTAYRLLTAAIWGTLVVMIAVCGIGIRLTITQHRQMQEVILQAQRRGAESQLEQLVDHLDGVESRALRLLIETVVIETGLIETGLIETGLIETGLIETGLIETGLIETGLIETGPDDTSLIRILTEFPHLRAPFFIRTDGSIALPLLRRSTSPFSLVERALPPAAFEDALRLSLGDSPVEAKVRELQRVANEPGIDPLWRLRARLGMAALQRRSGSPGKAVEIYRDLLAAPHDLLADHHGAPRSSRWPSFLQISAGLAETLVVLADGDGAITVLRDTLAVLRSGRLPSSLDAEAYFLGQCRGLYAELGLAPPEEYLAAEKDFASRRVVITDTENFRDWLRERMQLERGGSPPREPQHRFTESAGRLIPIVWTQLEEGTGHLAVGFQIDLLRLRDLLQTQLAYGSQGHHLTVAFSEKGIPEDLEHLASFPGELSFFSLALERHRWHEILDGARRPFVFAGALIGILGLILASSLLLIYRGLQRERALSRVKTEFVAGVSHELKTPLALIHLCGETLLLDRVRGKEQSEKYLRVITRETMRLSHLITNVLDFSSIEAGKKTYDLEPCDLSEVIRETIEHYRFHLEEKGFECSEDIPPTLPLVLADQQAVAQALVNLLQNGVRYSTDTRRLEVTGRVENGDVKISVRDFGVGISPSDQDKIWDDYFRTRQARALGTRGSGLGLSLVQHVMIAHGGNIELRSDLGEGSTFTLVFPVARGASREVSEVPNEQQDSRH